MRGHAAAVTSITFTGDGSQLISLDADGEVKVWSAVSKVEVRSLAFPWSEQARRQKELNPYAAPRFQAVGFMNSILTKGDLWAVSFEPKKLHLLEVTHRTDLQVQWEVEELRTVALSQDGKWFACACTAEFQETMLLEVGKLTIVAGFPLAPSENLDDEFSPPALAISPEGRFVAVADAEKRIKVWDSKVKRAWTERERIRHRLSPPSRPTALAFTPDGKRLISGGNEGIMVWDLATNQATQTLAGHKGAVSELRFSPDGRLLASAGADGSIRLWDIQSGKGTVRTLTGHTAPVTKIVFSPDGRRLASASEDGTIRMWEVGG